MPTRIRNETSDLEAKLELIAQLITQAKGNETKDFRSFSLRATELYAWESHLKRELEACNLAAAIY